MARRETGGPFFCVRAGCRLQFFAIPFSSAARPVIPPTPPPLPRAASRGGLSARKLILAVILAGSILLFLLILFVTAFAILREASPVGHTPFLVAVKRAVAHHFHHASHSHHK